MTEQATQGKSPSVTKPKKKIGRPSLYKPQYCQDIINFFNISPVIYKDMTTTKPDGTTTDKTVPEAAPTPFFVDWQIKIGISDETMLNWTKAFPEFLGAYNRAKQLQTKFLAECALKEVHSSFFTVFTMKNICGWRDVKEVVGEVTHNLFFKDVIKRSGEFDDAGLIKSRPN